MISVKGIMGFQGIASVATLIVFLLMGDLCKRGLTLSKIVT